MFKAINLKKMFSSIIIVELIGAVSLIIASSAMRMYSQIILPDLAISVTVFIILWVILFAMLGIALYFAQSSSARKDKKGVFGSFWLQLFIMCVWPILFFNMRAFGFAAIWMLILVVFVGITIKKFSKLSKGAAYLLVPYMIFCIYVLYLNYGTMMLN